MNREEPGLFDTHVETIESAGIGGGLSDPDCLVVTDDVSVASDGLP